MAATSRGIDVSAYQGAQDWHALRRGGLTFAAVKASEGEHTRDPRYRMHMDGLRAAGIMPQAYHYAWPVQDPHAEADNYISVVREDAEAVPEFVHWLDLEKGPSNYTGRSDAEIRAWAEAWIDRVRAAFPRQRVGTYTSREDIRRGHYPRNSDGLWYPAYPAGGMSYTAAEQRARPAIAGVRCLLWQFADQPTDRSICYMTPAALAAWAGQEDDPMAGMTPQDIYRAVWRTDAMPAPADRPDLQTNPRWQPESVLTDIQGRVRALTGQLAAQTAAVTALAQQLGKGRDVNTIVAAVQEAVRTATVHVEITGAPPAPADTPPAS